MAGSTGAEIAPSPVKAGGETTRSSPGEDFSRPSPASVLNEAPLDADVIDNAWCVYVLRCRGNYLYTGSTNNLTRRLSEHEKGTGSKFVRSKRPFVLAKVIPCETGQEARRLEYRLKKLRRKAKTAFLCLTE
jgi:putative endonuclease